MAIRKGHKKPLPPKTYEEVFTDLVKNLAVDINKNLASPIALPDQPTLKTLETIFQQIARDKFNSAFQYQFNAQVVAPPSIAPGTGVISTFESFFKAEDENKNTIHSTAGDNNTADPFVPISDDRQPLSQILDDFRSRIIGLPNWVQNKAQTQIVNRLETVFGESGLPNDWTTDIATPVFEQDNKYSNSVRLDYVFVRLSGSLVETDVKAQLDAVYCIGVYYRIISAATIAKKDLWRTLFKEATLLLNVPIPTPTEPTVNGLEALLIWYRDNKLFEADHGFPFKGTPLHLLEDLGRPTHLFIIEDDDFTALGPEIETNVLNKIAPPGWAASTVKHDLRNEIETLLKASTSDTGGWLPVKYDKTPQPPSKDYPTFLIKANFVHCTLISPSRSDVIYRGLYFCGVFYTSTSAEEAISQELLTAVYKNALRLVSDNITPPEKPTHEDLNQLLYKALDHKFLDKFRFAYNGDKTAPSDKVGNVLYSAKLGFVSKTQDDAAAEAAVDAITSAFDFPWGANEDTLRKNIRADLLAKTKRCLTAGSDTVPANNWDEMDHNREHYYADSSHDPLAGKAIILYCNGTVTAQGTTQKCSFIYFVGVFYEVSGDGDW